MKQRSSCRHLRRDNETRSAVHYRRGQRRTVIEVQCDRTDERDLRTRCSGIACSTSIAASKHVRSVGTAIYDTIEPRGILPAGSRGRRIEHPAWCCASGDGSSRGCGRNGCGSRDGNPPGARDLAASCRCGGRWVGAAYRSLCRRSKTDHVRNLWRNARE